MIAMREGHMLTLRVLAVKEGDLELFPGQVRAPFAWRQWLAFPATSPALGFDFVAAFDLLGVRDDGHHDAIAACVNPCFSACFAIWQDTIFRMPRHRDGVLLL